MVAAPGFRLLATMNPGGDFGKKELSPALANRFTTLWVPAMDDPTEMRAILEARLTGQGEGGNLVLGYLMSGWGYRRV